MIIPIEPELNESTDTPSRNTMSKLTLTAWICLLLVFIAFCTLCATIGRLDVYGKPEWRPPYQWLVECIVVMGLVAMPVGFFSGSWALLFRKDKMQSVPPTMILGLLLGILGLLLGLLLVG